MDITRLTIPFVNDSSEAVPPGGIMRLIDVTTINGMLVMVMGQPNDVFQQRYYVNGSVSVPSGMPGDCYDATYGFPVLALSDAGIGSLDLSAADWALTGNDNVRGAQAGKWTLGATTGYGFEIIAGGNQVNGGNATPDGNLLAVRQRIVDNIIVHLDDSLGAGQFTQAKVYIPVTSSAEPIDTGLTVQVAFIFDTDRGGGPGNLQAGYYAATWFGTCWLIVQGDSLTNQTSIGPPPP